MTRLARIVIPGLPHHITQRGVRGQDVFFNNLDREVYLSWMSELCVKLGVDVLSYCLMTNHVHHILVPPSPDSLAKLFKPLHIRYSSYVNKRYGWKGHLWQQRFYSSPLDEEFLLTAIRYVERNPVKANLVDHASEYQWSSAAARCVLTDNSLISKTSKWNSILEGIKDWKAWLDNEEAGDRISMLRETTARDLPCGTSEFIEKVQNDVGRNLIVRPRGRPKKHQPALAIK